MLPEYIKRLLPVSLDATAEAQKASVEQIPQGALNLFVSDDSRRLLASYIEGTDYARAVYVYTVSQYSSGWSYQKISFSDCDAEVIFVPENLDINDVGPEAACAALIYALLNEKLSIGAGDSLSTSALVGGRGYIVFSNTSPSAEKVKCAERISGFVSTSRKQVSVGIRRANLTVVSDSLACKVDPLIDGVFHQAVLEQDVKWRFLGFYRVFESVYLKEILDRIIADFMKDPEGAVDDARSSISSEISSFINLVESRGLQPAFEAVANAFDGQIAALNRFAYAIKKSAELSHKQLASNPKPYVRGILFVYKIRCAVVHAGSKDVVFESFGDGYDSLFSLLPPLELAALNLLGVKELSSSA